MIFLGLKEDCENLLSRFQATDSVRYEEFLLIWKSMKFSTIFFGGMRSFESNRFAREAFSVVSPFFLPPYAFQIRVGALYMLYGLYNTQLCQPKQKIRLALKDWSEVEQLHQDLFSAQHLDAVYVYRQLRRSRAFHFTAMPTMLTFRSQKSVPADDGKQEFRDARNRVSDLVTPETLEELVNIHEHYQKAKCQMSAGKSQADKSLNLVKEEFSDHLNSLVLEHQHWKQQKEALKMRSDEDKEGTSQESEGSERAKYMAELKSKSYTAVTKAVKSRRHRQVQLVSSDSGSDSVASRKAARMRRHNQRRRAAREAQAQAYLSLTGKRLVRKLPMICEENPSTSCEETPAPKKKRRR